MKPVSAVVAQIDQHLEAGWHLDAAGTETDRWPHDFGLGAVTSAEADRRYLDVLAWSHGWHDWVGVHQVTLRTKPRRIRGVAQELPTHVTVPDVDTAARAAGGGWPARIRNARRRASVVRQTFGIDPAAALRLAGPLSDLDFDLACTAARWFADHPDVWPGLTPRQVPVVGLQGKWLNKHRALVRTLAGIEDLTLAKRPTRIYWTYLDPDHRSAGGRRHDSLTLGDTVPLPYVPRVVLIVENKDTAVLFPELPGGIAVEGNGNTSTGLLPAVPWIAAAPAVVYWGDLDAAGYEIVDRLRARLPRLQTLLMDAATYNEYERFGTSVDERGHPLKVQPAKRCAHLHPDERAVYDNLTAPEWAGHRRVEQERIPLDIALARLQNLLIPSRTDA